MKNYVRGFALICLTSIASPAYACGFCPGDKAASVYCHESIEIAKSTGQHYVVVEVLGASDAAAFAVAAEKLRQTKGVSPKRVKTAPLQRTISFLLSKDQNPESLATRLSTGSLRFKVLQVIE